MGRMATDTTLGLDRHMLVDERTLLIDVALVANGVTTRQTPQLAYGSCSMWIVAVRTLHQSLVNAVVIGLREICLGRSVASVTQLRLALDEQELFALGVMWR